LDFFIASRFAIASSNIRLHFLKKCTFLYIDKFKTSARDVARDVIFIMRQEESANCYAMRASGKEKGKGAVRKGRERERLLA